VKHEQSSKPVLLLTEGDPWGEPKGGQTTFAKHLLTAFGPKLAVSSHCNDLSIPKGYWIQRQFKDHSVWFLNRGPVYHGKDKKPLIPARISAYFRAMLYMRQIRKKEFSGLLLDSPEMLFAAFPYIWQSICYRFAGVNNPVANSRYPWARVLGHGFEQIFISCLKRVNPDVMIAAADQDAIEEFFKRTSGKLNRARFFQFPTRVDTEMFLPMDKNEVRRVLGIPENTKVFVATGRLCWIKGWDLLLEAFVEIRKRYADSLLIFVGDGEDHAKLESLSKLLDIYDHIRISGFLPQREVVRYMNAADVCVVASHREGWSLAMCEMIACGKPVVSTDVSGSRDMVVDGLNGFVVSKRDPTEYCRKVLGAMELTHASEHSLFISQNYALTNLSCALSSLWPQLKK